MNYKYGMDSTSSFSNFDTLTPIETTETQTGNVGKIWVAGINNPVIR